MYNLKPPALTMSENQHKENDNETLQFTNPLINKIDSNIISLEKNGVGFLPIENISASGRFVQIRGQQVLNFITNSCFGLETHPAVKQGMVKAFDQFGASFIVSRIFASTILTNEFETLLSKIFNGFPLVFMSTSLAHLAALPILIQKNDLVLVDCYAHNSLRVALKTIEPTVLIKTVRHNDFDHLEKMLIKKHDDNAINTIWYINDGINSVSGAHCPMDKLALLLKTYPKLHAYIDDAHGMSVFGRHGRGYALQQFDKPPEKLVVAVSLSKSFGLGAGGVLVFPNETWKTKIMHCGPTSICSSPLSPPLLGAGIALANIHLSNEMILLQKKLQILNKLLVKRCHELNVPLMDDEYSSMQFIRIGNNEYTFVLAQQLLQAGLLVNPFVYPGVKDNSAGLRIVVNIHHTPDDIEQLVTTLYRLLSRQRNNKASVFIAH